MLQALGTIRRIVFGTERPTMDWKNLLDHIIMISPTFNIMDIYIWLLLILAIVCVGVTPMTTARG